MRDFKLDLSFNFSGHLDLDGNARRNDTLKQAADSREQSPAEKSRCASHRGLVHWNSTHLFIFANPKLQGTSLANGLYSFENYR
jgi:hypothetical protein